MNTKLIIKKLGEQSEKLAGHNRRFDYIESHLNEHNKRFDHINSRLNEHDKRFDSIDARFDILAANLLKHDQRLDDLKDNMATKHDFNRIVTVLDGIAATVKRIDEDRFITHSRLNRIEQKIGIIPKTKPA